MRQVLNFRPTFFFACCLAASMLFVHAGNANASIISAIADAIAHLRGASKAGTASHAADEIIHGAKGGKVAPDGGSSGLDVYVGVNGARSATQMFARCRANAKTTQEKSVCDSKETAWRKCVADQFSKGANQSEISIRCPLG